ncbi:MAG: right-handed parallel beta-helix repeat-containing protein [Symploca sp. SIO3E6]|nr:right-handed parallel beta-helix repeat-containing protein [Caldora sp. SIO3E6]
MAISEFEITDAGDSGISGMNLANVKLTNNQITQAQNRGIILEEVDGTVEIANNKITNTVGVLPATPTTANPPTGQGIGLFDVTGTVEITDNQITGTTGFRGNFDLTNPDNNYLATGQGIALINTTAGEVNLTISGNQLENNGIDTTDPNADTRGDGIGIFLEGEAIVNSLDINNNTISNNGGNGVIIEQGLLTLFSSGGTDGGNSQINNATISDNTIENNTQQGIFVRSFGGTGNLAIENNPSISDNGSNGIRILANGNAQMTANINNNTNISNNNSFGIEITANENTQITTEIVNNSISQNRFSGIGIFANGDAQITAEKITNNSISQNGAEGIEISAGGNGQITTQITNNTDISDNGSNGISIFAGGDGQIATEISNNTNISNNNERGINIFTNPDNGQIDANVQSNVLTNNGFNGAALGGRLCINLNDNESDTDYQLTNVPMFGGTLQVVDLMNIDNNNIGTVTTMDAIDVPSCP